MKDGKKTGNFWDKFIKNKQKIRKKQEIFRGEFMKNKQKMRKKRGKTGNF
jgi:hypothetical protein